MDGRDRDDKWMEGDKDDKWMEGDKDDQWKQSLITLTNICLH